MLDSIHPLGSRWNVYGSMKKVGIGAMGMVEGVASGKEDPSGTSGLSGARFRQKSGAARIFEVVRNKSEF